jgi:excisionase family DNA binding protein
MSNNIEPMDEYEEVLTVEEIAKQLKVSIKTVRHWINSGELIAVDLGRGYRISRRNLNIFLRKRQTDQRKKKK